MQHTRLEPAPETLQRARYCLRDIVATLWPEGNLDAERGPGTLEEVSQLVAAWGFGPHAHQEEVL